MSEDGANHAPHPHALLIAWQRLFSEVGVKCMQWRKGRQRIEKTYRWFKSEGPFESAKN